MSLIPFGSPFGDMFSDPFFGGGSLFASPYWGSMAPSQRQTQRLPALNFDEDDNHYYVNVDVPGMTPHDIQLDYNDQSQVLTIRAEHAERKETGAGWEHSRRSFTRSFTLPIDASGDRISAHLEHGVLSVTLPKKAPPAPRRIPISSHPERAQIGTSHTTGAGGPMAAEGAPAEEAEQA